jgi:hypothetical protein
MWPPRNMKNARHASNAQHFLSVRPSFSDDLGTCIPCGVYRVALVISRCAALRNFCSISQVVSLICLVGGQYPGRGQAGFYAPDDRDDSMTGQAVEYYLQQQVEKIRPLSAAVY